MSKPIVGGKGVYVIDVTKITTAEELDNYSAIASRLSNALKTTVNTKVYSALEKVADIEDNRATTVY